MPTRREFLSGAGTVLTGLMFPAVASAWGRRRRRCSCPCPPPAPTCPCAPGQMPHIFQPQPCQYACPTSQYGQSGLYYYYHCVCCPGGITEIDASSMNNIPCPQSCTDTTLCIPTGQNPAEISATAMTHTAPTRRFLLDNGTFLNGLPYANPRQVFTRVDGLKIQPQPWFYKDGKGNVRACIVWDVTMPAPHNNLTLYTGREVDKSAIPGPPAAANTLNFVGGAGHHHRVQKGNTVYHIITRDP